MHRRWLKSRSSQQSQILPDSIGLVIHNARLAPTLPQFRSAFGCLRHPGIFDTDVEFIHLLALPLLNRTSCICVTWKVVSSSQCGLIVVSSLAIRLCSLTNRVCIMARICDGRHYREKPKYLWIGGFLTVCSLALESPARKQ